MCFLSWMIYIIRWCSYGPVRISLNMSSDPIWGLCFFLPLYVVVSSFQFQRYCWWTISEKNPLVNDKSRCESCPSHVFWIIGAAFTRGFAAQFAPPNPKWWSPPNRSGFRMTRRPNAHVDDFGVILAHKLLNQYHNIHVYIWYEWMSHIYIYDILYDNIYIYNIDMYIYIQLICNMLHSGVWKKPMKESQT